MKYILIALLLVGCMGEEDIVGIRSIYPKYHFGDTVKVYSGFYKNTEGTIHDVRSCIARLNDKQYINTWCYTLQVMENVQFSITENISEQELTE